MLGFLLITLGTRMNARYLAETERFELSMRLYTPYSLSRVLPGALQINNLREINSKHKEKTTEKPLG